MLTVSATDTRTGENVPVQIESKPCVITHEGRAFEAGGAYVTPDVAYVYVGKRVRWDSTPENRKPYDERSLGTDSLTTRVELTNWGDEVIGYAVLVGQWKQYPPNCSYYAPYTMQAYSAVINGRSYYGRLSSDWSQLLKLRAYKGS